MSSHYIHYILSSGDYVSEESETVEVTNEAMEEDSDGDAMVTAEDSTNMVKPENRDKVGTFHSQNYAKSDFFLV